MTASSSTTKCRWLMPCASEAGSDVMQVCRCWSPTSRQEVDKACCPKILFARSSHESLLSVGRRASHRLRQNRLLRDPRRWCVASDGTSVPHSQVPSTSQPPFALDIAAVLKHLHPSTCLGISEHTRLPLTLADQVRAGGATLRGCEMLLCRCGGAVDARVVRYGT